MSEKFATILIDPSTLCREGLARILADTRFEPLARLTRLEQVEQLSLAPGDPILFMVDFGSHPDTAADGVRRLKAEFPSSHVLVLADQYEARHLSAVLRAGADGYLTKTMSCEALIKSLDLVVLGEPVFPSAVLDAFCDGNGASPGLDRELVQLARPLSERETEILRRLVQGESNKIIARQFDITEATVKVHIKAILRKIRVKNRTQAAIWALDHGIAAQDATLMSNSAGAAGM